MLKNFRSLEDTIQELCDAGLLIIDEEEAKAFFSNNHPYKLRGYLRPHLEKVLFVPSSDFGMIKESYELDSELRHLLLLYLEKVETHLKTAYCLEFMEAHGATDYLNASLYRDAAKHQAVMEKAEKQRKKKAKFDKEYRYHDDDGSIILLPIYKFVELLTIKDITDLYSVSEKKIKSKVALSMGLTVKMRRVVLENFMRRLTFLRNRCAHGGRLYDFDYFPRPYLSAQEESLLLKKPDGSPDDSRLFGYFLILKRLLSKEDFLDLKNKFISLLEKYPNVDVRYYGFPSNWQKIL